MDTRRFVLLAAALAPLAWGLHPERRMSQIQKHNWQIEDGLPHNYVNAIALGPDGYLLIGTDEGLVRFDGAAFTRAGVEEAIHLDRRWIVSLIPARAGGYWAGTYDSNVYRVEHGAVREQFHTTGPPLGMFESSRNELWYYTDTVHRREPSGRETAYPACRGNQGNSWQMFAEDQSGAMWSAFSGGLCRYRNGVAETVLSLSATQGAGMALLAEGDGTMWVGTSKGVLRMSGTSLTPVAGVEGPVSSLLRDRGGALWVGTWGKGLFRVTAGGVASFSSRDGLADDFIRTVFEDPEGNLWLGSRSGGLNRWRDTIVQPFGIPEGLGGNFASAVAGDAAGTVWLGTYRSGLFRFDGRSMSAVRMPEPALDLVIGALLADAPSGSLWVGALEGLFRYRGGVFERFTSQLPAGCTGQLSLAIDQARRFWIGCESGLYRFAGPEPKAQNATAVISKRNVHTLLAARDGSIWAGTNQGLAHIDADRVTWISAREGLPDPYVRYVSQDAAGRIWATTNGTGLTLVDAQGVRTLDSRGGLPAYRFNKLLDDGAGTLWISSAHGIFEIAGNQIEEWIAGRRAAVAFALHDLDEGMRSVECHAVSQPGGWRGDDGTLWFPTAKGFVRIRPTLRRHLAPPRVVIEQASPLRLVPGARDIEVRYTALRFGASGDVRFRYRLEGADSQWSDAGPQRLVRFASLAPGNYRLLVAARDEGGDWSTEPAALTIEQLPRFYQTIWFRWLIGLLLGALAVALYRWRERRVQMRYAAIAAERNRIARDWHDTLLAGLSGVSWQLEAVRSRLASNPGQAPAALDTARKMVDHCAAEARRVIWDLRDSGADNPTLPDAVDAFLVKLREGSPAELVLHLRGQYRKLPYDTEHHALRLAQEAVANAVRHARASHIEVVLEYTSERLMLTITDDGCGFTSGPADATGHFGILGMRERVLSLGGEFEIASASGEGTRVCAAIPLTGVPAR